MSRSVEGRWVYADNQRVQFLLREIGICRQILNTPDSTLPNGQSCHDRAHERMFLYEAELSTHLVLELIPSTRRAAIVNCGGVGRKLVPPAGASDVEALS